ncbi:hypothetical protein [Infirmifilum sp. SLHALR2]|nr:MAG: hypothetical protein B7L53_02235 [Thermofilum sp. NZ13]
MSRSALRSGKRGGVARADRPRKDFVAPQVAEAPQQGLRHEEHQAHPSDLERLCSAGLVKEAVVGNILVLLG